MSKLTYVYIYTHTVTYVVIISINMYVYIYIYMHRPPIPTFFRFCVLLDISFRHLGCKECCIMFVPVNRDNLHKCVCCIMVLPVVAGDCCIYCRQSNNRCR